MRAINAGQARAVWKRRLEPSGQNDLKDDGVRPMALESRG